MGAKGIPIYEIVPPGNGRMKVWANRVTLNITQVVALSLKTQVRLRHQKKTFEQVTREQVNAMSAQRMKRIYAQFSRAAGRYPLGWGHLGLIIGGSLCRPYLPPEETVLWRIIKTGGVAWDRKLPTGETQAHIVEILAVQKLFGPALKEDRLPNRPQVLEEMMKALLKGRYKLAELYARCADMRNHWQPMDYYELECDGEDLFGHTIFGDEIRLVADSWHEYGPIRWEQLRRGQKTTAIKRLLKAY